MLSKDMILGEFFSDLAIKTFELLAAPLISINPIGHYQCQALS
jgi:hypothetical protein